MYEQIVLERSGSGFEASCGTIGDHGFPWFCPEALAKILGDEVQAERIEVHVSDKPVTGFTEVRWEVKLPEGWDPDQGDYGLDSYADWVIGDTKYSVCPTHIDLGRSLGLDMQKSFTLFVRVEELPEQG